MKIKNKKTLSLNKLTVQKLTDKQMVRVRGGNDSDTTVWTSIEALGTSRPQ